MDAATLKAENKALKAENKALKAELADWVLEARLLAGYSYGTWVRHDKGDRWEYRTPYFTAEVHDPQYCQAMDADADDGPVWWRVWSRDPRRFVTKGQGDKDMAIWAMRAAEAAIAKRTAKRTSG